MDFVKKACKLWSTPAGATLISMIARSGNTFFLLPFISQMFPIEYFNVWMLFAVIYSLKDLLDLGLVPNFSRVFSYAYGGIVNLKDLDGKKGESPNNKLINQIYCIARKVYFYIAIFAFILISVGGTIALWKPISVLNNDVIWFSWLIIIIAVPLVIFGNIYSSLLLGIGKVVFIKKWDAIFNVLALLSSCLILYFTRSFLLLVLSFYIFNVLIVVRNYIFVLRLHLIQSDQQIFDYDVWMIIRNLAAKNFIAGFSSFGLQRGVEILIGNVATAELSSSYLFSSRLLEQLKSVSAIYFYPKIQIFAFKCIQESRKKVLFLIQRDMFMSSILLFCGIIFLFLGGWKILKIFGLNVDFVSTNVWIWMGIAALLERCISMFAETYGILINKVISHVGLIVSGGLFLLFVSLLNPQLGIQAIPMSFAISYLSFYLEYVICKLKSLQVSNIFIVCAMSPVLILCVFYGIFMCC